MNAAIQPLSTWRQPEPPPGSDGVMMLAHTPARSYPTPEIMRRKADQLAAARKDVLAAEGKDVSQVVELMRAVAHDMESGAWE